MKTRFDSAEKIFRAASDADDVARKSLEAAYATGDDAVVRAAGEKYEKASAASSLAADIFVASIIITASNRLASEILRCEDMKQCQLAMPPRSMDCDDEISAFLLALLNKDDPKLDLSSLKFVRQELLLERRKHVKKMDSVFDESLNAEGEMSEFPSAKVDKIRREAETHISVLDDQIDLFHLRIEFVENDYASILKSYFDPKRNFVWDLN